MEPYHIKQQHQETETIQSTVFQIATGCTQPRRAETKVLSMDTHLKLHAAQLKQLTQTQTYPLHDLNAYSDLPRNMKTNLS